jgi:hypothetical protein
MRGWRLGCVGVFCILASAAAISQESLTDHQRKVERAGTALMFAVPAAALLATWVLDPAAGAGAPDEPHWLARVPRPVS